MIHSKDELLDYVIRYMAENSLEMNTFEQMKFACFADWLQKQNFCKPDVSRSTGNKRLMYQFSDGADVSQIVIPFRTPLQMHPLTTFPFLSLHLNPVE